LSGLGYLPYLGFIFLPGVGFSELFHLWKEDDGFTARLAYAFGIGLCIDTAILAVRTAGVTNLLTGLDSLTVYATIAFGLGILAASVIVRRRFSWWRRPTTLDLGFLAVLLLQGLIILLYFQKYPIFPTTPITQDFGIHAQNTQGLISGTNVTIPHGILYDGVYYQLSPALLMVGGASVITNRWTMALLAILSPLLIYLAAERLFASQTCGLIAAVLYALSGPIWFGSVFLTGLYPNFFGILAALFLLVAFVDAGLGARGRGPIIALVLATFAAYFSHFSIVTVLPAILIFPVVARAFRWKAAGARPFVAAGIVILPGLAGVAVYPHEIARVLFPYTAVVQLGGSTTLSSALSFYPVLGYMASLFDSDLLFIIMTLLCCVYIWRFGLSRSAILAIPIIWFGSILVASPFSPAAWRFSIEALVPFTLMASFGLFSLLPKRRQQQKGGSRIPHWKVLVVLVLILSLVLVDSWGTKIVADSLTNTSLISQEQGLVNQSIVWLGSNTPSNATYLSISDSRFTFTSQLIGRETVYHYTNTPTSALQTAHKVNATYIIVTFGVTENLPPIPSLYPWDKFPPDVANSNLSLVYQNSDVRIYQIV
jgi:hypothetical protein